MCIAIFKPAGIKVRKKLLKECFSNNPDGIGFAYPSLDGSRVDIAKGYFSFRQFWEDYRKKQETGCPILIHFRVATSGKIDPENCHPWRIDDNHALIHNGILEHKIGQKEEHISDTGLFTEFFLKPIFLQSPLIWTNPSFKWIVQESIGINNKIAILRNDGEVIIFNEKQGEWHEGVWFSNKTYKDKRIKGGTRYLTKTNYVLPRQALEENSSCEVPEVVLSLPAPKNSTKKTSKEFITGLELTVREELENNLGDYALNAGNFY